MKKAIIYARVSTRDQNPQMQIKDLRKYVKARKLKLIREYVDYASGSDNGRTNYLKLIDDVRKRKCDVVVVWKFDRFARSTKELINALEEFKLLGVDFISFQENVDTSTPAGKVLFTMISAFAEFEREVIRERVIAGMKAAKEKGKRIGRPPIKKYQVDEVKKLKSKGIPWREIIKRVGISKSSYYDIINKKR